MYFADFMNPMLILFCHFDIPYLVVFDGGDVTSRLRGDSSAVGVCGRVRSFAIRT